MYSSKIFKNNLLFGKESFIGRNLSSSYAPKESDLNYSKFIDELSKLFDKYSEDGILRFPNNTICYAGEV